MKRRPSALPVGFLIAALLGASPFAAAGIQFEVSAGSEYSSLKLADRSTSTIWYAPFSARLDIGNWTVRATIPYVSITAPNDLIVLLDDDPTGAGVGGNGRIGSVSQSINTRTVSESVIARCLPPTRSTTLQTRRCT